MKQRQFHSRSSPALIALCLTTFLIGSVPTRAEEPMPKGTLSGRVIGPDGQPVVGARVWIDTYNSKRLAEARTDAAGRFRLGPVAPVYRNPFPLYIEAEGLARQDVGRDSITIFPGADHDLGTITLVQGRRFTGQILDVDSKPKANIEVECAVYYHYLGHTINILGPSWKLTTDADGRYRTPPLPVGLLQVTVKVPGRQVGYAGGKIAPGGEETLEPIRLKEDVPLTGFVRDEQGRPIAGAEIRANADCKANSDAEGKFVLRGFGPNPRFQMRVIKEGYVFANCAVNVSKDGLKVLDIRADNQTWKTKKDLSITLPRVAWMEGRAVDADTGDPVRLEKIILCDFERKSNGEIVRRG
jgi:hypothetical protein